MLYAEECPEICHGIGDEPVKCLWAGRRGQSNTGNVVLGTHYRLADQEEQVSGAISHSHRP